jgi:AhpD family alkylhydroperoxidase
MRVDYRSIFPVAVAATAGLERAVHASSVDVELFELVKLRASQLNGCGYCFDMHTKDAKRIGVDDQRSHLVVV